MQVEYNGYLCQFGSTALRIVKTTRVSQYGKPAILQWHIFIDGYIRTDTSTADLTAKMEGLETAFSTHGGNFRLLNSGSETAHRLESSNTINGIHVAKFAWERGRPVAAEYVARRSWSAVLSAQQFAANAGNLMFYQESVRCTFPGSVNIWQPALFSDPQKQTVQAVGSQIAIQRGTAVGINGYPDFPLFLYPSGNLHIKQSWQEPGTPRMLGTNKAEYPISWFYVFEGINFSLATPTAPAG